MVFAAIIVAVGSLSAVQSNLPASAPACQEWHDCQRLAWEAYTSGEYERFHDLAWRAVQTGPSRDPTLMYLLARAQSLSGRPHDALVMLGRLTEVGFATDAATDDDFRAVRQLRQWAELDAAMTPAAGPASVPPPAAAPASVPPPAARSATVPPPAVTQPPSVLPPVAPAARHAEEELRIPGTIVGSAGLAYDRVSSRFVVVDAGCGS